MCCNLIFIMVQDTILSRPRDYQELFNYQHVQLRNVIEHTFGVLKRCFKVAWWRHLLYYDLWEHAHVIKSISYLTHMYNQSHMWHFTQNGKMSFSDTSGKLGNDVFEKNLTYYFMIRQDWVPQCNQGLIKPWFLANLILEQAKCKIWSV